MQLQANPQKKEKIMSSKVIKENPRDWLTYLDVLKKEKEYDWCFEGHRTTWTPNSSFLVVYLEPKLQ